MKNRCIRGTDRPARVAQRVVRGSDAYPRISTFAMYAVIYAPDTAMRHRYEERRSTLSLAKRALNMASYTRASGKVDGEEHRRGILLVGCHVPRIPKH